LSAGALGNLALDDDIATAIAEVDAIPPQVDLLCGGLDQSRAEAAGTLANLALHHDNVATTIAEACTFPPQWH
jgi:hypothetical protein